MSRSASTGPRLKAVGLLCVLALSASGIGIASPRPKEFRDNFNNHGSLAGYLPGDPWDIRSGSWKIADTALSEGNPAAAQNRVLIQDSRAITPNEPIAFVRGLSFREMTVEVTAAFLDPMDAFGKLRSYASLGVVARAPVFEGRADSDNFYMFSSFQLPASREHPTGQALGLFKRVARGYIPLDTKYVHTWADLTQPHKYKLVIGRGHIRAYFDNRLVIDHVDLPLGEDDADVDPFSGLPFDQGAAGLRTSGTRAWFDNFVVVGNDAYEGRAGVVDGYTQAGEGGSFRQGAGVTLLNTMESLESNRIDTGYQYGGDGIEAYSIRAAENPFNQENEFGATAETKSVDGKAVSTVRLAGGELSFREPINRGITVNLVSKGVEVVGTAGCGFRDSKVAFVDGQVTIDIVDDPFLPDMKIGPIPLNSSYAPNTVIWERAGAFSLVAHPQRVTSYPNRVEAAALWIGIPDGGDVGTSSGDVGVQGIYRERTPATSIPVPPAELVIGPVTAGRYCA